MKDLYGKTYAGNRRSGSGAGLLRILRVALSDVRNLERALIKHPVVLPAILLFVNSLACFYSSSCIPAAIAGAFVIGVGCYLVSRRQLSRINRTSVLFICLIMCSVLIYSGVFISSRLNAPAAGSDGAECVVTEVSRDLSGGIDAVVRLDGGALAKVRFFCDPGDIGPGDTLVLGGKVKEPQGAGNPGEFDYREYLHKKGILYTVSSESCEVVRKAGFPLAFTGFIQKTFFDFRINIFECVTVSFDEPYKALVAAVCFGDRSLISDSVSRDFEMSCCSHLLAVSGMHFSGFLLCVPMLLQIFRIKRRYAFAVHAVFCILIGCLTGWSDSVTRAAIMSICVFADREWVSALSLSAAVMILADPFCALSSGFQMSLCSVIAIKVYSEKIAGLLMKMRFPENAAKLFSLYLAATAGLIPFWSDISMRPDPEHLVIQIAAAFIAGAACTFFVPCVVLCLLFPYWSDFLSDPLYYCLYALSRLVGLGSLLSEQSGMPVHLGKKLLVMFGIFVFLYMIPPCLMRRILIKPVAVFLAIVIGSEVFTAIKQPDCRVIFADVGQGDCCLIITPDKTCLIDGGTYSEGSTTVRGLLDYYGISKVDICIMSHWDTDHAGGIAALYAMGRTRTILTSYNAMPDDADKDVQGFVKAVEAECALDPLFFPQLSLILAGDRITLSDGVYFDVLYPSERTGGGNESSLVLMLHIDGDPETSILFTGDIGSNTESLLIGESVLLDCDILKVAHHGSKYSTSSEFIEACSPDAAVISVGANNLYGHPAPATLERLESYGCDVFRTDTEGAVVLEF